MYPRQNTTHVVLCLTVSVYILSLKQLICAVKYLQLKFYIINDCKILLLESG